MFVGLSVPLALVGVFLLTQVDFAATPHDESPADDVVAVHGGCLDWWCRGEDAFIAALAAVLLATALATFVWGARRRER
jgi:hypothetical protein